MKKLCIVLYFLSNHAMIESILKSAPAKWIGRNVVPFGNMNNFLKKDWEVEAEYTDLYHKIFSFCSTHIPKWLNTPISEAKYSYYMQIFLDMLSKGMEENGRDPYILHWKPKQPEYNASGLNLQERQERLLSNFLHFDEKILKKQDPESAKEYQNMKKKFFALTAPLISPTRIKNYWNNTTFDQMASSFFKIALSNVTRIGLLAISFKMLHRSFAIYKDPAESVFNLPYYFFTDNISNVLKKEKLHYITDVAPFLTLATHMANMIFGVTYDYLPQSAREFIAGNRAATYGVAGASAVASGMWNYFGDIPLEA